MKKIETCFYLLIVLVLISCHQPITSYHNPVHRDSIVYHITYRDTTIYKYDTIHIKHYVHSDTLMAASPIVSQASIKSSKIRKLINPNSFGIGPSVGAYYSPFNGFDVNIGFSIQYYILSIPSFRKPHVGHKHNKK